MHKYTTRELILELKAREERKKKARVIWTRACQRNCDYCSNKYDHVIAQMQPLTDLRTLADNDEIIITGGEPMLMPEKLWKFLKEVKFNCPNSKLYLYTALADGLPHLRFIVDLVDGVHFTLHRGASYTDVEDFHFFQSIARSTNDKSFRLSVDPDIQYPLSIIPAVWKDIRIKTWFDPENCPVPVDESLHIWKGGI
jgi:hypothetical protein